MTAIQGGEDPWFGRVKVDALDTLGACKELALYFESAHAL